jgi:hypothetical protein
MRSSLNLGTSASAFDLTSDILEVRGSIWSQAKQGRMKLRITILPLLSSGRDQVHPAVGLCLRSLHTAADQPHSIEMGLQDYLKPPETLSLALPTGIQLFNVTHPNSSHIGSQCIIIVNKVNCNIAKISRQTSCLSVERARSMILNVCLTSSSEASGRKECGAVASLCFDLFSPTYLPPLHHMRCLNSEVFKQLHNYSTNYRSRSCKTTILGGFAPGI